MNYGSDCCAHFRGKQLESAALFKCPILSQSHQKIIHLFGKELSEELFIHRQGEMMRVTGFGMNFFTRTVAAQGRTNTHEGTLHVTHRCTRHLLMDVPFSSCNRALQCIAWRYFIGQLAAYNWQQCTMH
ncbi:hypothetical protein XELAEV_18047311mg [Xenopus laevis]|uniref:Uncharacterized protein n=1 Tax=Xenopus laevis TaxID=8355 RepID=A0A974BVC2_XENLA|nr:hypothetical protein XELAEV_18047311mg [Xenopus laevis]